MLLINLVDVMQDAITLESRERPDHSLRQAVVEIYTMNATSNAVSMKKLVNLLKTSVKG